MDTLPKKPNQKIIIEGITNEGKIFRPRDWAERISGSLSTFKNHRMYYSPLLKPSYRGGHRCVVLDPKLKETNPKVYEHVLEFAKNNNLKVSTKEEKNYRLDEGDPKNEKK